MAGKNDSKNAPVYWLRLILRPVMRACLRHSLKLQEIVEICKAALIDVAREEIERGGSEPSVSRLSIITGVHRPDVTRIVNHPETLLNAENPITRLIGQWQGDKRFSSSRGRPRVLKLDGRNSEFAGLVHSVSSALNPYTVLFELERIGAVERTAEGLKLIIQGLIGKDFEQAYGYLSRDCNDLIISVEENVARKQGMPNLHMQTEYDQVGVSYLEQIRRWFIDEGNAFHTRARKYLAQFDKDINPKVNRYEPVARVAICTFSRAEEEGSTKVKKRKTHEKK